jgi:hypothetical protein
MFELDPRLRDQAYGWCAAHAGRLSLSRLQGLSRSLPEPARKAFHGLAATKREHARVRWPDGGEPSWPRAPEVKARHLPLERPALFRFRARALCGVGASADVLSELIVRSGRWTRASDLVELGYSKRAIAGILSELAEAGLAKQLVEGNALTFQLSCSDHLREVLGARDLAYPPWQRIMTAVHLFLDLASLEGAGAAVWWVEANNRREAFRSFADQTRLEAPPQTRGDPDAWHVLVSWATGVAADLADGSSIAFNAP